MELKLIDLATQTQIPVVIGEQVGSGAQGRVYRLHRVAGRPSRHLLKLYTSPSASDQQHALGLIACWDRLQLRQEMWSGLPQLAVGTPDGATFGFFMYEVPGGPLDDAAFDALIESGLSVRIAVAWAVAEGLARFEAAGLIHADLNLPNVVVDIGAHTAYPIDADGGGLLETPDGDEFAPGLAPTVTGKRDGSSMAPELFVGLVPRAGRQTDRWALAVLTHQVLIGGLDPFFYVEAYADVVNESLAWPDVTGSGQWWEFHQTELARCGPSIGRLFTNVFSTERVPTATQSSSRATAREWSRALEAAGRWILTCSGCGEEIVAEGAKACPLRNCGVPISHAAITMPARSRPCELTSDGQTLLGRDFFFSDEDGRYNVMQFRRRGRDVEIVPGTALEDVSGRQTHLPNDPIPMLLSPGVHQIRVWSRDGQRSEMATLRNPL